MSSEGRRRSSLANQDNENRESRSIRFHAKLTQDSTVQHLPVPPPPPSSPLTSSPLHRTSASTRRTSGGYPQVPYSSVLPLPLAPTAVSMQPSPPPPTTPPPAPPPSALFTPLSPASSPPRTSFSQPSTSRRVSISKSPPRVSASSQSGGAKRTSLSETSGMPYEREASTSMATALRMLDDSYMSYSQARKKLYNRLYNEGQFSSPRSGQSRLSFGRGHSSLVSNNAWPPTSVAPGQSFNLGVTSNEVTGFPVTAMTRICMGIVVFLIIMASVNFLVLCLLVYHTR